MKQVFIATMVPGDSVDEVFALAEKSMGQKKDGNPYLNVVLADRSGQIKGVVWDQVAQIAGGVQTGDFVHVNGSVSEYRGSPQIVIRSMRAVQDAQIDPSDFLPAAEKDLATLFERLVRITRSLETPWLQALFEAFWQDADFVARFRQAPAAKKMHHAYLGGLLVHCLSMAVLADKIAAHYNGIDRDLLVAGAVLHDVGKVRELAYAAAIDYSDEGRLLSHIVIGLEMIEAKLQAIPDAPREQVNLLKHLVVSHHGEQAFGSPEPPKTIEAVVLHYIDELDSKVNAIREFMAQDDPHESWTGYHRILGRHFYRGPAGTPHDTGEPPPRGGNSKSG